MRGLCILLFLLFSVLSAQAQVFSGNSSQDYQPGQVYVKIKEESRSLMEGINRSSRVSSVLPGLKATPLSQRAATDRKNGTSSRTKPLHVDISKYYQITYDPSLPLDQALNALRKSGYFEMVEPVPVSKLLYVPNDVNANQYYINIIKAEQAWDITKGSNQVVIAIVDTGGELTHPDLVNNLYYNKDEIPNNGIDDDKDGYIDNTNGWDFVGGDTLNINNPSFIGDNDPTINKGGEWGHGTFVAGCASAATDNGIGMAGVGFNTKILFTKHTAENALPYKVFLYNAYQGVLYAAETLTADGVKPIINCSFGGEPPMQIVQDLINHVTLDLGAVVVAAAGNSNNQVKVYPASYDNVISVAATNSADVRASFSTYNTSVDISAPGSGIFSTAFDNTYDISDGTSFASPLVAGAAALVWAVHPEYTFDQVGEQLRISADSSFYSLNPSFRGLLGTGRLNVYKAVSLKSPSLRISNGRLINNQGLSASPGETAYLYVDVENLLQATSPNLQITITSASPGVTINRNSLAPGSINTKQVYSNAASPFVLDLSASIAVDQQITISFAFSDGTYQNTNQKLMFIPNPSYLNADQNQIFTSIASNGRIGFGDPANLEGGVGFQLDQTNLLSELGIIMGTSSVNLFNNVRSTPPLYDNDLVTTQALRQLVPGHVAGKEIQGAISNSINAASQAVSVSFKSMDWGKPPNDKFIIMEYVLSNPTSSSISNFFFGLFADWDISTNGSADAASWNDFLHLGYVNAKDPNISYMAGIQLLTPGANYYAIDNDPAISGNSIGLYDGFTHAEKFTSISSGVARTDAGTSATGDDVSHVVAAGPLTIPAGGAVTVAFALHAAPNQSQLFNSALYADSLYNIGLKLTPPAVSNVTTCPGTQVILVPSGGTNYNWYTGASPKPFLKSAFYTQNNIQQSEVLYVTSTVGSYESKRDTVLINLYTKPTAAFSVPDGVLQDHQNILFTDQSTGAVKWNWDFGDNSVSSLQSPTHIFGNMGAHKVKLEVRSSHDCKDTVSHVLSVITGIENNNDSFSLYPNPIKEGSLHLNSSIASQDVLSITLTDATGVLQYHCSVYGSNEIMVPVSNLPDGIYILMVTSQAGTFRRKVIKYGK